MINLHRIFALIALLLAPLLSPLPAAAQGNLEINTPAITALKLSLIHISEPTRPY